MKTKKPKEIVLYDTTNYTERYDQARDSLFDSRAYDFDWETADDVPEKMIYEEMSYLQEIDYQYFSDKLTELFNDGYCIITGTCGRWNGKAQGGKFLTCFEDFCQFVRHLDEIKIIDNNGHLIITGYHHDGNDCYELKKLTRKGYEYADNNYFAHSRKLHENIMKCNLFSKLPRLANL